MIDTEELPPPSLAVKLGDFVTYSALCRLHAIGKSVKPSKWGDISLLAHQSAAAAAGYVAGVRHERKRQRQKATSKPLAPGNITGQELELLQAWRMIGDADRAYIFRFAKYMAKTAQKEKEPADAATRQQACTE
ncbi:hypothetical protein [Phascolarctobacterium succinatutens]|uniref:hypothetical protein n=1 Tax=Phascolarctobacterium succinatutens TaxID=626940 RepID=UPI003AF19A6E